MSTKKAKTKKDENNAYKTKEEAEELIQTFMKDLRFQIETRNKVAPQAILLTDFDPNTRSKDGSFKKNLTVNHIDLSFTSDSQKQRQDAWNIMRSCALACGGFCSMVAAENWMEDKKASKKDVLAVCVEHKSLGLRYYTAKITTKGYTKLLGQFELQDKPPTRNQFERILPAFAN